MIYEKIFYTSLIVMVTLFVLVNIGLIDKRSSDFTIITVALLFLAAFFGFISSAIWWIWV